ncbi:sensor histidine kinase [Phytomonospora endophytica]|uniref:histidine kinase n=1 Tax=Phytomonospora endophytica TaxID=714109 RepID=A0A841FMV7_9ACTN|nr:HAMP domain-containing sensor histidine kinase [Phytomonospora endophytica]MBB6033280.1 two-component system sensor histidine kinase VanS [Phytomonospora endophytica]GIG65506.1 two-component sensor histidine kinase [Phytomonospora endophytica]
MKRRLTIHTRLFLGFGVTLTVAGILMVAVIYLAIRFIPSYELGGPVKATPDAPVATGEVAPEYAGYARTVEIRSKEDVWATVLTASVAALAVVVSAGLAAGWIVSRRSLAPIRAVGRATVRAADGDLGYRINATGPPDEITQLADGFDAMLARLENSFDAHRRFAANASHELMTPLAANRAILQVATADMFDELAPMLAETNERNIAVVTALLDLAAAEHAEPDPAPVPLGRLAAETAASLAAEAAAAGVTVEVDADEDGEVAGNSELLRMMLANLLRNAIAYNHDGGEATVAVYRDGGVVVEVDNTGPHVDPATVDRLFEPFHRPGGRVAGTRHGHGLGLAIVRAVAAAHRAELSAQADPDGGLVVRVRFARPSPSVSAAHLDRLLR